MEKEVKIVVSIKPLPRYKKKKVSNKNFNYDETHHGGIRNSFEANITIPSRFENKDFGK